MTKSQVLQRLCKLTSNVNENVFKHSKAADCFCGEKAENNFQFEEDIILFIEDAVKRQINYLSNATLETSRAENVLKKKFMDLPAELKQKRYLSPSNYIFPQYKVGAIKHIRDYTNLRLTESKWVSENWSEFESFIMANKRVPSFIGDYPNYKMI